MHHLLHRLGAALALLVFLAVAVLGPAAVLPGASGVVACSPADLQVQAASAETLGRFANTGLDLLGQAFLDELLDAERNAAAGETDVEARGRAMDVASDRVKAAWRPVWGDPPGTPSRMLGAWDVFREAHDVWATAIESGGDRAAAEQAVQQAFCALAAVAPPRAQPVLAAVGIACPGAADAGAEGGPR